jgi:hypothetical protein
MIASEGLKGRREDGKGFRRRPSKASGLAVFVSSLSPLLAIAACSTTDGTPLDTTTLNLKSCNVDLDCGPGRHCSPDETCGIDCVTSKDCAYALADPSAPNDLECSLCGRCVSTGTRDSACLSPTSQPCATASDCTSVVGPGWTCDSDSLCAKQCGTDDDCKDVGRGWGCGDQGLCVRKCFRDQDCYFFGWEYACTLPPGVDPTQNAGSQNPVFGKCVAAGSVPGFKAPESSDPPSAAYQGTYGVLLAVAVVLNGVPILTQINSTSVQHVLAKVTWSGNDLTWDLKWCEELIQNFNDNDSRVVNLFQVVYPDRNVDSILLYHLHAPSVPALAPGATFTTDTLLDLRGAKLANPETDPLPTYKNLANQWDQDRDANPGLTANVSGVLTGNIYQAQRVHNQLNVKVVDKDHMMGLVTSSSEATILGATDPQLVNDAVTSAHPQSDRTYFRAVRLADDASCEDVITVAQAPEGGWLYYDAHYDDSKTP